MFTVVATTLATLAARGAGSSWLLELFSHFPAQYLVLQVLAAVACLALGRRNWALLALVAAVPNVHALWPYLPGLVAGADAPAGRGAGAPPVRLIAANLLYRQEDAGATRAYLDRRSPDLVVLSEFTPRWREKLRELERAYPHVVLRPRLNAWGLAIYSRYPLRAIEDLDLGDTQSSNLRVLVQSPGGLVEVYGIHLASPPRRGRAAQRNTQLRLLARRIAAADPALPRIVAGDFNVTPWSPHFRDLLRDARLRDARVPFGLKATWPALPAPVGIPIDHCLVSGPLEVTRVATGDHTGSDHWPLECDFRLSR